MTIGNLFLISCVCIIYIILTIGVFKKKLLNDPDSGLAAIWLILTLVIVCIGALIIGRLDFWSIKLF